MPENLQPPRAASRIFSWFGSPHVPQILGDLIEEFNDRAHSTGLSGGTALVLVGHTSQHDRAGGERRNDWQSATENLVPDLWYLVQHHTVVDVALAGLAPWGGTSSVGRCDGCGFSCVPCIGDWLVGPFTMGIYQTRFAFAYAAQTFSIRSKSETGAKIAI